MVPNEHPGQLIDPKKYSRMSPGQRLPHLPSKKTLTARAKQYDNNSHEAGTLCSLRHWVGGIRTLSASTHTLRNEQDKPCCEF